MLRCVAVYRHRIRIMLVGDLWEAAEMMCEMYKCLPGKIQDMKSVSELEIYVKSQVCRDIG